MHAHRITRLRLALLAGAAASLIVLVRTAPAAGAGDGITPFDSFDPSLSANGRLVAFDCQSDALGDDDANGQPDVLLRDTKLGTTTLVSVDSSGTQGDGGSILPSISANGRFIAFQSSATNLVPGDENGHLDIFLRDRKKGTTTLVSVSTDGEQADADCFGGLALSANGRFVAFTSSADNLVPGDGNLDTDVFVRDLKHGTTELVSVSSTGVQGNFPSVEPVISASGRFVAFESQSDTLVEGDDNSDLDIFVHDRATGETTRVSVSSSGGQGSGDSTVPSISGSGRYVAFESEAEDLVEGDGNLRTDIFRHDRKTGATVLVSAGPGGVPADDHSFSTTLSASGRLVGFVSAATNLVADDADGVNDAFVADMKKGTVLLASLGAGGQVTDHVGTALVSPKGRHVAMTTYDETLVAGDTNNASDVYVRDLKKETTIRASLSSSGGQAGP